MSHICRIADTHVHVYLGITMYDFHVLLFQDLHSILTNSAVSVSPFELINCKAPQVLEDVLSNEDSNISLPLNVRLKNFCSIFMGLPENDSELSSWVYAVHCTCTHTQYDYLLYFMCTCMYKTLKPVCETHICI